jgi:transcriptional regulator
MYLPKYHQLNDRDSMWSTIDSHALGAWVCHSGDGLIANHLPFFLDRSRGPFGTLMGHVSRANPVWHELKSSTPSVVMFSGPQSYITPGWYPSKSEHGEVVPTWNYLVVHAHGNARMKDDHVWMLDMLQRMVTAQESKRVKPWSIGDAPEAYIAKMLRAIVGIEIPIERLEGKLKVSQDEALQDRLGTVQGLLAETGNEAHSVAQLVRQSIESQLLTSSAQSQHHGTVTTGTS